MPSICMKCGSTNVGGVAVCEYCEYVRARNERAARLRARLKRLVRKPKPTERGSASALYLLAVLMGSLTFLLVNTACSVDRSYRRQPAGPSSTECTGTTMREKIECLERQRRSETAIDFEHVGYEPEYVHGAHCIDSRSF